MESFSSVRRRGFLQFFLVVLILGIFTNLISDIISEYLNIIFLCIQIKYWIGIILLILIFLVVYFLILIPHKTETFIYTNIMINDKTGTVHHSLYAPWAIQFWSKTLYDAMMTDDPSLVKEIMKIRENPTLILDLIEHLLFQVLSGFEPFWLSRAISTYGYTGWIFYEDIDRKPVDYMPSTIFSFKVINQDETDEEYKKYFKDVYMSEMMKDNKVTHHLLNESTIEHVSSPMNWIIMMPMNTSITINREIAAIREVKIQNKFLTITIKISKKGSGIGLPYGIRIYEEKYVKDDYSTYDFLIDIDVKYSRFYSLFPKMEHYEIWANRLIHRTGINFGLNMRDLQIE